MALKKFLFLFFLLFLSFESQAQFRTHWMGEAGVSSSFKKNDFFYGIDVSVLRWTTPVPSDWISGMCDLSYFANCTFLDSYKNSFRGDDGDCCLSFGTMASLFFATIGFSPSWQVKAMSFRFNFIFGFQGAFRLSEYFGIKFSLMSEVPAGFLEETSVSLKIGFALFDPFKKRLPSIWEFLKYPV